MNNGTTEQPKLILTIGDLKGLQQTNTGIRR
jgi:hypothetical protein